MEMRVDTFEIKQVNERGQNYYRVHIAPMQLTTRAGEPQVPTLGVLLGLPTTVGVGIEVVEAEYETVAGYRLYPAPQLSLREDDLTLFAGGDVYESFALDAELYGNDAFYPGEPAQLSQTGYAREQAIAQVQFYPVQYNPVQSELRIYHRVVARITWQPTIFQASTSRTSRAAPVYDDLLRKALLNYKTLDQLIEEQPTASGGVPAGSGTQTYLPVVSYREGMDDGPRLKIGITESGLYKLSQADLLKAGMNLDGVDPRTLRIHNRGAEISIYVEGEADGVLDSADFILFYATALRDAYAIENSYWLSAGGRSGLRMGLHNGAPSGAAPHFDHFPSTIMLNRTQRTGKICLGKQKIVGFGRAGSALIQQPCLLRATITLR